MDTLTSNPADCSVPSPITDTGLLCLLMVARFHDLPADGGQIQHQFGQSGKVLATQELLRAAKHIGFRVGLVTARWEELATTPLPAIVQRIDGRYVVLAKVQDDKVLIHDPLEARSLVQSREMFVTNWSGRLLLCAKRAGLRAQDLAFDITWFIPCLLYTSPSPRD